MLVVWFWGGMIVHCGDGVVVNKGPARGFHWTVAASSAPHSQSAARADVDLVPHSMILLNYDRTMERVCPAHTLDVNAQSRFAFPRNRKMQNKRKRWLGHAAGGGAYLFARDEGELQPHSSES